MWKINESDRKPAYGNERIRCISYIWGMDRLE